MGVIWVQQKPPRGKVLRGSSADLTVTAALIKIPQHVEEPLPKCP